MNISTEMIADLIINIVSILVLFTVVRKLAYKPVKKFMQARTERVMKQKQDAEELAANAKQQSEEYSTLLKNSADAEKQAFKKGEERAKAEAQKIIADANDKANSIIATAQKKAEEAHKKMLEDAEDEIIDLSIEMSSKLLGREMNDDDNKKIVRNFLGDKNA